MSPMTHGPKPNIHVRLAALHEALAARHESALNAASSAHNELLAKRGEQEGATSQHHQADGANQHP